MSKELVFGTTIELHKYNKVKREDAMKNNWNENERKKKHSKLTLMAINAGWIDGIVCHVVSKCNKLAQNGRQSRHARAVFRNWIINRSKLVCVLSGSHDVRPLNRCVVLSPVPCLVSLVPCQSAKCPWIQSLKKLTQHKPESILVKKKKIKKYFKISPSRLNTSWKIGKPNF